MAHVGTITGSMVLDPYIAALNRAAQDTAASLQSSIQVGTAGINAFAKVSQSMANGMSRLNGSVYASMTVLRPFPCREFFSRSLKNTTTSSRISRPPTFQ